jgi:hypothetical protein
LYLSRFAAKLAKAALLLPIQVPIVLVETLFATLTFRALSERINALGK